MRKHLWISTLVFTFLLPGVSLAGQAQVPGSDPVVLQRLDELATQVSRLQQVVQNQNEVIQSQSLEIEGLKGEKHSAPVYIPNPKDPKPALQPSWLEGMKQGGDFRLRYEAYRNRGGNDQDSRNRFRMRLRYGVEKQLNEEFTVGFRIGTGSATENSTSNQTMTGNFNLKSVFFDKLYVKYAPLCLRDRGPIAKVEFGGGKVDNPLLRGTGLATYVWHPEVYPEGIYETIDFKAVEIAGQKFSPFLTGVQFPLVESSTSGIPDAEAYGVQFGWNSDLKFAGMKKPVGWLSSIGYYTFPDYGEGSNFIVNGTSFARGNTVDPNSSATLLAKDFQVLNVHQEFKLPTPILPSTPFADYAVNLGDASSSAKPGSLNNAWGAGLKLGDAKKKGDWEATYAYYYIEPNSVVGAFSDNDFGGPNYTAYADRRGSLAKLTYKVTDFLSLGLRGYFVEPVTGTPDEFTSRYQSELLWKF